MKLQEFIKIVLQILTNWYVVGTVIAMIIIISFANYVLHYKRKMKKKKKKNLAEAASKPKAPPPAPAPAEGGEQEASE